MVMITCCDCLVLVEHARSQATAWPDILGAPEAWIVILASYAESADPENNVLISEELWWPPLLFYFKKS